MRQKILERNHGPFSRRPPRKQVENKLLMIRATIKMFNIFDTRDNINSRLHWILQEHTHSIFYHQ